VAILGLSFVASIFAEVPAAYRMLRGVQEGGALTQALCSGKNGKNALQKPGFSV
jgi:hypothetical protein